MDSNLSLQILREIYTRLQDDQSKTIYTNRILYEITKERKYLWGILNTIPRMSEFYESIKKREKQKKIIFGAGLRGRWIKSLFPEGTWNFFVDNKITGKIDGLPVITIDELCTCHMDAYVIVPIRNEFSEIVEFLESKGFAKSNIFLLSDAWNSLVERQYFDLEQLYHEEEEVFVDVGGYDGCTSLSFAKWASDQYQHIYIFEPNKDMEKVVKETLKGKGNWSFIPAGVWCKTEKRHFRIDDRACEGKIVNGNDASSSVSLVTLDEILGNKTVTYIKMDIEGSELEALEGAKKLIRDQCPKIAIAIYHKIDDLWNIPSLLINCNPKYKFYIRHYSMMWYDTILYAI